MGFPSFLGVITCDNPYIGGSKPSFFHGFWGPRETTIHNSLSFQPIIPTQDLEDQTIPRKWEVPDQPIPALYCVGFKGSNSQRKHVGKSQTTFGCFFLRGSGSPMEIAMKMLSSFQYKTGAELKIEPLLKTSMISVENGRPFSKMRKLHLPA